MKLLNKASMRHLKQHRFQSILSLLGVALGVAVVLSIDLAIQSARIGFQVSAEAVAGLATHAIQSDRGAIDEELFTRLKLDLDVSEAAPVVEGSVTSTSLPGRTLRILGLDPFSEEPFRPYTSGTSSNLDVGRLMTTKGGVILTEQLAAEGGLTAGDSIFVSSYGTKWTLPIVGLFESDDRLTRSGLSDVLVMDISGAQEIFDMIGYLTRIDLRIPDADPSSEQLVGKIADNLPNGVRLENVGTRSDTMAGMIQAFDVNLTALSLLAVLFGMFLIYNSMTFSIVSRRASFGRLRALGVTRDEILRSVLKEAFWIGASGTVVGLALGIFLAQGLIGLITQTINDLYFALSVRDISIEPVSLAKSLALGIVATVISALPPALEAAGSTPRAASIRSVLESKTKRMVPMLAWSGVALCLLGWLILFLPTRSLGVSFISLFAIITGMAAITPLGTVALVELVKPTLATCFGTLGSMAVRGIRTTLSRTAPAIAALVISVSVTVGLGIMIDSFRGTLINWLDGTLQADIYVSLPGPQASRASGTLSASLIQDFITTDNVVGYSTYRAVDVIRDGDTYRLVALGLDRRGEDAFDFQSGDPDAIMRDFQAGRGAIVSEPYAYQRQLAVGDSISLTGEKSSKSLPILGIFYDYGSEQGTIMVSRGLYDTAYDDVGVTSLGLFLDENTQPEEVVSNLLTKVPVGREVTVRSNASLRSASLEVFDRTFTVTGVLRLLAFIVAFVGVLSALTALQMERTHELGLLRASGLTSAQLKRLVIGQSGLMGLIAGVLAIPVGILLSVVMIQVINKRSFGWSIQMQIDPEVIIQGIVLALFAALLAGIYPALRMANTSPSVALRGTSE
ncbi:MAG: FtsX-like permease family protein [Longimicrobiales bacterium]